MTANDHAPSLHHSDLDRLVVPHRTVELVNSLDSTFAAVKLMKACIDQGRRELSILINKVSQLESEIATLKTENRAMKAENMDLLERNTKANLDTLNLRTQLEFLSQDSPHFEKCHLSEKLPDPELYNGDKQKLRSWTYSLRAKLAGNSDHYPLESSKIQ